MRLAAVCYEHCKGEETDQCLVRLARHLKAESARLAGVVQVNEPRADKRRCVMTLEDLATGRRVVASEDRGPFARGCQLDTGALEEAVGHAVASLSSDIDLVIVNRFGKREAEGRGFRSFIEQSTLLGVPVLVGLNRGHLEAWRRFLGEDPVLLPPDLSAVLGWCAVNLGGGSRAGLKAGVAPTFQGLPLARQSL